MRRHARTLGDNRCIHIADAPTLLSEQVQGIRQEGYACGVAPAWVTGGKVRPDIAEGGGAQQGVHQCMQQRVGV